MKKVGLNLVLINKEKCPSAAVAAAKCRKYIKANYILDPKKIHYIRLDSLNYADVFIVSFENNKFIYKECTDAEYNFYFKYYFSSALRRNL